MSRLTTSAIVVALAIATYLPESRAAIMYSTVGATYTQDFDSLPNTPENVKLGDSPVGWKDDDAAPPTGNFSIVGWHIYHPIAQTEGGFNGHQRMRIGAGTATTGTFMSFGSSGSTERALGMVSSNTMSSAGTPSFYGAKIHNDTGMILRSFTLNYTGEQWRDAATAAQFLDFDYSLNASSIQDGAAAFVNVDALDFASPANALAGARDGNAAANRTAIGPVTVSHLNWAPGTDLWIRWRDLNDGGSDHGLAIDDVGFSADIPEPGSMVMMLAAALALMGYRRLC